MFQRSPTNKKKGNLNALTEQKDQTRNKQRQGLNRTQSREKLRKNSSGFAKNLGFDDPKSSINDLHKFGGQIRPSTGTIIKHLDERDQTFTHKYKELKSHSKCSDFQETKKIIEQLLNKHAEQRSLSLSEQYILTGYLGKYVDAAKKMPRLAVNPFNIIRRLQTKNSIQCSIKEEDHQLNSPRKTNRSLTNKKKKNLTAVQEKKTTLNKELERLKFLWQIYKLKSLTCPQLNRIGGLSESQSHKEMTEFILRLKDIQRNRGKAGQQKSLADVQKVMRNFQQTLKKCLC